MKIIRYILVLLYYCEAADDNIWMNWTVKIKMKGGSAFCYGVLLTYSHALTTCDCATHSDFIFPEFLRKKAGQHVIEIRENHEGYQSRKVLRFDPHPKCTSSYFVQGFLNYNFAIVSTALPFEETKYVQAIQKRLLNSIGAIKKSTECTLMGHEYRSSLTPFPIKVKRTEECSKRAATALGSPLINFEETGMLCLDIDEQLSNNMPEIGDPSDTQIGENSNPNATGGCDGTVVSGAPVVCDGSLAGLVSHGLCKLNSAPVIISRIELTSSFVDGLSLGEKSAISQTLLTIFAEVILLVMNSIMKI